MHMNEGSQWKALIAEGNQGREGRQIKVMSVNGLSGVFPPVSFWFSPSFSLSISHLFLSVANCPRPCQSTPLPAFQAWQVSRRSTWPSRKLASLKISPIWTVSFLSLSLFLSRFPFAYRHHVCSFVFLAIYFHHSIRSVINFPPWQRSESSRETRGFGQERRQIKDITSETLYWLVVGTLHN